MTQTSTVSSSSTSSLSSQHTPGASGGDTSMSSTTTRSSTTTTRSSTTTFPATTTASTTTHAESGALGSGRAAVAAPDHPAVRTASVAPGDPAVTAVDFAFHPGTVTVSAGATITWTNSGAQPHTATANGGSFDTGILKTGQSASHTFTQPGTFSYFCTVHPFMKGTIVVLPAAGRTPVHAAPTTTSAPAATAASPGPARPAAGATTAASPSSAPTLPLTGMPVLSGVLIGLLLILLGSAVRRAARAG